MNKARAIGLTSLLTGFSGALVAVSYDMAETGAAVGIVLLTVAFCAFVGLRTFYAAARDLYPDFLTIFLVFQLINKLLTILSLLLGGTIDSALGSVGVAEYRANAELVFLAETVLFWIGWRLVIPRPQPFQVPELTPRQLAGIYLVSLGAYILTAVVFQVAALGTLVSLFRALALGVVTLMLYGEGPYALGKRRSAIPLLMMLPWIYLSLQSGSKSDLIIVAMPVLLAALKRLSAMRLAILSVFTTLMFVFVVPLTLEIRNANWLGVEDIGVTEASSRVAGHWESDGPLETARAGALEFLHRASSADSGALVMAIADRDGHIGAVPIEGALSIFIPRMLWPDKPLYAPGAWFTWYLGYAESPETATTSTAMMLGTELYWMYGVAGLAIGVIGLGLLYAVSWRLLALEARHSLVALASLSAFLVMAIRFEETAVIYAISAPIIFVVYVKTIALSERLFAPPRSAARR